MTQIITNSHDYFDVIQERDNIFREVFRQNNLDVHSMQKLYDFCSHDTAFTDLADYFYTWGNCMDKDNSFHQIIQDFIGHVKQSDLFNEDDLEYIQNRVKLTFGKPLDKIKSHREKVLEEVLHFMDTAKETMH